MIDLWEMMGRLVTDPEFRADLTSNFPSGTTYTPDAHWRIKIPANYPPNAQYGDEYDRMRTLVHQYMPKPLSLMALGEMIWALTFDQFHTRLNDLGDAIGDYMEDHNLPDDNLFYIALGALILDQYLPIELFSRGNWHRFGFAALGQRERKILADLANPQPGPQGEIAALANNLCVLLWDHECNDSAVEWPAHTHPVALYDSNDLDGEEETNLESE